MHTLTFFRVLWIVNQDSLNIDFRVETDDKPYCLFVNSTQNNVSIGYSAESLSQTPGLVILSKDTSGGVYLIKEDGSQPSSGEGLGSFGWRGTDDTNSMNAADARITAFAVENHSGSDAATDMRFYTKTTSQGPGNGPTEVLRLTQTGDVIAQTGDIYFATAGKGIVLGATTNVDANTLDDYEEGTWTPTLLGTTTDPTQSYNDQDAYYTKVGNVVHITGWIYFAGSGITTGAGALSLNGLPFTIVNALNARGAMNIAEQQSFNTAGAGAPTTGFLVFNSTTIALQVYQNSAGKVSGTTSALASDVQNATRMAFTCTYTTAA